MASSITSRSGRARLSPAKEPYWTRVKPGVSLGYRKLRQGAGSWIGRYYDRGYTQAVLGTADDLEDPNDKDILDYGKAVQACIDLHYMAFERPQRTFADYTVNDACDDYIKHMRQEGRAEAAIYDAQHRIDGVILKPLGHVQVRDLTSRELKRWRDALTTDRELATVNRYIATLKAILTLAFTSEHVASKEAWERLTKFKGVNVARERWLTVPEAKLLLKACDPPFRDLVNAALCTGCRLSELLRLKAGEFNRAQGTVYVSQSKSGKARNVVLARDGVALFKRLIKGKAADDIIIPYRHGRQTKDIRKACERAGLPQITFHGLRHTYASLAIQNGVPLLALANNLGHSTTEMIERHYGHLAKSFVSDAIRAGAPKFK